MKFGKLIGVLAKTAIKVAPVVIPAIGVAKEAFKEEKAKAKAANPQA